MELEICGKEEVLLETSHHQQKNKFGLEEGGWCSRVAKGGYGVGVWKSIRKEWEGIRCRSRFIVGNERKVKFWKDLWCKDQTLKEAFPKPILIGG